MFLFVDFGRGREIERIKIKKIKKGEKGEGRNVKGRLSLVKHRSCFRGIHIATLLLPNSPLHFLNQSFFLPPLFIFHISSQSMFLSTFSSFFHISYSCIKLIFTSQIMTNYSNMNNC